MIDELVHIGEHYTKPGLAQLYTGLNVARPMTNTDVNVPTGRHALGHQTVSQRSQTEGD